MIGTLLFSLALTITQAKNVSLTLQGNSNGIGGAEFINSTLNANYCLQEAGWDAKVLTSDMNRAGHKDILNDEMKKYLKPGSVFGPVKGEADVEERYLKTVAKTMQELNSGDQFLLRVSSHGSACSKEEPDSHCIYVQEPGTLRQVPIHTDKLAQVMKENTKPGVTSAVDLLTCFGGKSIPAFANAGICAHAHATADSFMIQCGGDDKNPTSVGDLTVAYQCRNSKTKMPLPISPDANRDGTVEACYKSSEDYFNKSVSLVPDNASFESLSDKLRMKDTTSNQHIGTDGPYWVFGSLSDFGFARLIGDKSNETYCEAKSGSISNYIKKISQDINNASKAALKTDCDLGSEIEKILEPHKNEIGDFFKLEKDVKAEVASQDQNLSKVFSMDEIKHYLDSQENVAPQMRADLVSNPQMAMAYMRAEVLTLQSLETSEPGIDPKMAAARKAGADKMRAVLKRAYGDNATTKVNDSLKLLASDSDKAKKATERLTQAQSEKLIPIERDLYAKLKNSPTYKRCIEKNENLKAANEACEKFKM